MKILKTRRIPLLLLFLLPSLPDIATAFPLDGPAQENSGLQIIVAQFGAVDGWVDVTGQMREHIRNSRLELPSLKPVLQGVRDPSFGHHKSLVVVYRFGGIVRTRIVPTDGVAGAWGSLRLLPASESNESGARGFQLLVAGENSDNIVRFDSTADKAFVVARLATGSRPWSLAVSSAGEIFVGLRGGKKNIVRLSPGTRGGSESPLLAQGFTGAIGRFGPGLMAFDKRGFLAVAADTHREVRRYDTRTGKVVASLRLRAANLVGLTISGDSIYAAEYFQRTILRFDMADDPPSGHKLVYKSQQLDRPHGMTIGHNGNLFVASLNNALIQEFDIETGKFHRTLLDVRTIGGGNVKDLKFDRTVGHYFLSSGNTVYQVSPDGALVDRYQSPALLGATAIVIRLNETSSTAETESVRVLPDLLPAGFSF